MVVAGPPNARDEGMCWEHGIALADILTEVTPDVILFATGIFPVTEENRQSMPINEKVRDHFGGMTLKRLGELCTS